MKTHMLMHASASMHQLTSIRNGSRISRHSTGSLSNRSLIIAVDAKHSLVKVDTIVVGCTRRRTGVGSSRYAVERGRS